jgi:hypothetical protein
MTYAEIREKLEAAQHLLAEVYDIPELVDHEESAISCADGCIIDVLDSLHKRGAL